MTTEERNRLHKRMESMLSTCRRRIRLAAVQASLRGSVKTFVPGLLFITGSFLVVRLLGLTVQLPLIVEWTDALLITAFFAAVLFGRAAVVGFFGDSVRANAAAERLDLSQATHNRIATAMMLLRGGNNSPFVIAAINEGVEHLERLYAERPHVEISPASWRYCGLFAAFGIVMLMAGQLLGVAQSTPAFAAKVTGAAADRNPLQDPVAAAPGQRVDPNRVTKQPRTGTPSGKSPEVDEGTNPPEDGTPTDIKEKTESAGPSAQNASGKARNSKSSSSSRSASGAAGVKADAGNSTPSKKKKPEKLRKPKIMPPKPEQSQKKAGSIDSRGSSGSGAMRTTQNDWSNKVKGKSSKDDDSGDEEELDEESEEKKQRIGAQPSLKNRVGRLSRELSLSIGKKPNDNQNRGRGGPSAAKKARGVATMIMGVPVPGFVKGTLLPGPTKSTQEKMTPTPRDGEYAKATVLQPIAAKEMSVQRFRATSDVAATARDYLIRFHAEHENKKKGDKKDE